MINLCGKSHETVVLFSKIFELRGENFFLSYLQNVSNISL